MSVFKKFYQWGIVGNVYLSFHIMFAFIFIKSFEIFTNFDETMIKMFLICIVILWEIIEVTWNWYSISTKYGSIERWAYDTLGDIIIVIGLLYIYFL